MVFVLYIEIMYIFILSSDQKMKNKIITSIQSENLEGDLTIFFTNTSYSFATGGVINCVTE